MRIEGINEITGGLARLNRQIADRRRQALTRATLLVHRESISNAPRSPTSAQLFRLRKTKGKTRRNPDAHSRPKPGGLRRSIEFDVNDGVGEIFVALNSEAGKYAARIHDERYISWWNRGPGTIALGERAKEKFIERALNDNRAAIDGMLDDAVKGLQL
jgi:hypothetical protein